MSKETAMIAAPGTIWVCLACGKTERDLAGITRGWDVSCAINAVLCVDPPELDAERKPKWVAVDSRSEALP